MVYGTSATASLRIKGRHVVQRRTRVHRIHATLENVQ